MNVIAGFALIVIAYGVFVWLTGRWDRSEMERITRVEK
jgi:hypothetical protein